MSNYHRAFKEADLVIDMDGEPWMPFRLIPACPEGFWMGSRGEKEMRFGIEQPRHKVVLTEPFYMGSFPVTQEQYAAYRPKHGSRFKGNPRNPVEKVSWEEAVAFCDWLTQDNKDCLAEQVLQFEEPTFRLPTEAQWEYTCRAGTNTEYWSGDEDSALAEVGWFFGNSDGETKQVCGKPANGFKLYDMHGNVFEWCRDGSDGWLGESYRTRVASEVDPCVSFENLTHRVMRGGSWDDPASNCRSAYRYWDRAGYRDSFVGFRLCLFPGPPSQQSAESIERTRRRSEGYSGQKAKSRRGAGCRRDAVAKDPQDAGVGTDLSGVRGPEIGGSGK